MDGYDTFDAYANRDSLSYRKPYGLENIPTLLRGTLRFPGYCKAWNELIKLNLTNDSQKIAGSEKLTWIELIELLNPEISGGVIKYFEDTLDSAVLEKLRWLGIFSDRKIMLSNATTAQILQHLLEEKWKLKENDKDMIVMQHRFEVRHRELKIKRITSSLVVKGDDSVCTAMAKTVGLPAAISAKLILQNKIKTCGVIIPTLKEIYTPVLAELETFGIKFIEKIS